MKGPGGPPLAAVLFSLWAAGSGCKSEAPAPCPSAPDAGAGDALALASFAPRSRLHAKKTAVPAARFPVVDFHQHVNSRVGDEGLAFVADKLLALMDATNVATLVILTGPRGKDLERLVDTLVKPHPDRFVVFTMIDWSDIDHRSFGKKAAAQLRADVARGARGLKVLKELGLYLRDEDGRLLAIDDPRFDPIWKACGDLGIPVAIHSGDPEAFFDPVDAHNERYEELKEHPDWSFADPEFPRLQALLAARDRVIARHPRTTFVALHVGGWPENLDYVSRLLSEHPNVFVELGARQAELGRQPRRARQLFVEYPDRILFGTDFWPSAEMYANHFRWLETEDEYFPYWDHPAQGRWNIYGLGLPGEILKKVYNENARRILSQRRNQRRQRGR